MKLDGKEKSGLIMKNLKTQLEELRSKYPNGERPGLAVVLVGNKPDSELYVEKKIKACSRLGIKSVLSHFSSSISQHLLLEHIQSLNEDPSIHGILVQLPLPEHIKEEEVLSHISLSKDIDGFHAMNMGNLAMHKRQAKFIPCTPKGIMRLLEETKVKLEGKIAVIIGTSNIVGLPVALLLNKANATVITCNKFTNPEALKGLTLQADILVTACGQAEMITGDYIKDGVIVIDVGINHKEIEGKKKLVGDVEYSSVSEKASWITPVPGGVGPMTVAMLMENTIQAYYEQVKEN